MVSDVDRARLNPDQISQLESLTSEYASATPERQAAIVTEAKALRANGSDGGYYTTSDGTYAGELKKTLKPTVDTSGTNNLEKASADYYDWYKTAAANADEAYLQAANQRTAAYDKALEAQTASLNAQLESNKTQTDQALAKQDYYKRQAGDNRRLYNQINGDLGGVGQAQYSAEQNAYDQAMLDIDLQRANLINETNAAIAEAQANNDYEKANALYELALSKMDYLNSLASTYHQNNMNVASQLDSNNLTKAQLEANNYATVNSNFLTNVQNGVYDEAMATQLGLTEDQKAKYRQIAEQNLKTNLGTDQTTLQNQFDTKINNGIYDENLANQLNLSEAEKAKYQIYADNQFKALTGTDKTTLQSQFDNNINSGIYSEELADQLGYNDAEKAQLRQIADRQFQLIMGTDIATAESSFLADLDRGVYDEEMATMLGYSDSKKAQLKQYASYVMAGNAPKTTTSTTGPDVNYDALYLSGYKTPGDVYNYLMKNNFSSSEAKAYADYFEDWLDAGGADDYKAQAESSNRLIVDTPKGYVNPGISKIDYNTDEGVFTWNGKVYGSPALLLNAIQNTPMTEADYDALKRSLNSFGWDIGE